MNILSVGLSSKCTYTSFSEVNVARSNEGSVQSVAYFYICTKGSFETEVAVCTAPVLFDVHSKNVLARNKQCGININNSEVVFAACPVILLSNLSAIEEYCVVVIVSSSQSQLSKLGRITNVEAATEPECVVVAEPACMVRTK